MNKLKSLLLFAASLLLVGCSTDTGGGSVTGGDTGGGSETGGGDKETRPWSNLSMCNPSYDYYVLKNSVDEYVFKCEAQHKYTFQRKDGDSYVSIINEDGSIDANVNKLLLSSLTTSFDIQYSKERYIKVKIENTYNAANQAFKFIIDPGELVRDNFDDHPPVLPDPFQDALSVEMDTSYTVNKKTTKIYKIQLQANYAYQMRDTSIMSASSYVTIKDKEGNFINGIDNVLFAYPGRKYLSINSPVAKWVEITVSNTYNNPMTDLRFILESSYVRGYVA